LDGPHYLPNIKPINGSLSMSDLERTPAGLQMVISGCERFAEVGNPRLIGQGLLSFYRSPTLREQFARRANAPLLPSKAHKALPRSSLFGH
jgi:hypothetical protein